MEYQTPPLDLTLTDLEDQSNGHFNLITKERRKLRQTGRKKETRKKETRKKAKRRKRKKKKGKKEKKRKKKERKKKERKIEKE